ncbi:MAG TPA: hypothetical protein ENN55_05250, partial [Firmicutes bacterium]|nr:hypothetical protein [Bacillota bacterium]
MKKKEILLCAAVFAAVFLSSCGYSDYVHMDYTVHHGAAADSWEGRTLFLASTSAYRNAKGLAAFPDGGVPRYLLKKTALYRFDSSSGQLDELADFSDLAGFLGVSRSKWAAVLFHKDGAVFYRVGPAGGWEQYEGMKKNREDILKKIKEKY